MTETQREIETKAALLFACRTFYPDWSAKDHEELIDELLDVLHAAGESKDPRAMGWVDDRGLP